MRRKSQTKHRPEQILAHDIIKSSLPNATGFEMEYKPKNIVPLKGTDLTGDRSPRLDIAFSMIPRRLIAVRLMGPIHDEKKRQRYDFVQQTFLEMQNDSWVVIDFWYQKMPNLFKRNTRKLTETELKLAYNEVKRTLQSYNINLKFPTNEWSKLVVSHCNEIRTTQA